MKQLEVPDDHEVGMRVPEGGSSCAKCSYLSEDEQHCGEKHFQAWNGGGDTLPAPAQVYCCDFFKTRSARKTVGAQLKEQKARKS